MAKEGKKEGNAESTALQALVGGVGGPSTEGGDSVKFSLKDRKLREEKLAKVVIDEIDVDLIEKEFEMSRKKAERVLREAGGDVMVVLKRLATS